MSFEKGNRFGKGRPRGAPNKRKILKVEDVLANKEVNPVEQILALLPSLPASEQCKVWLSLMPYVYRPAREPSVLEEIEERCEALGLSEEDKDELDDRLRACASTQAMIDVLGKFLSFRDAQEVINRAITFEKEVG